MIISRTPFRISFFGGGTDYPAWFRENGGAVLSTAIDKYCYISCRYLPQFFEHKYRIVYSKIENTKVVREIEHPAVRAVLTWLKCDKGLEIHHDGQLVVYRWFDKRDHGVEREIHLERRAGGLRHPY